MLTRSIRWRTLAVVLGVGIAPLAATAQKPARDLATPARESTELTDLLSRASAYVQRFEQSFSGLVAEERYVQIMGPWTGTRPRPAEEPELVWREGTNAKPRRRPDGPFARRQLLSDFLLVQTAGHIWTGYRDVAVRDGRAVRDREERVRRLFLSKRDEDRQQLRQIAGESARYNLGGMVRTINTPTFPLQVLAPSRLGRFAFAYTGTDALDAQCCVTVSYVERRHPTIVATRHGEDVPLTGRLWIEPESGRVRRTTVELEGEAGRVPQTIVDVSYRTERGLEVLVPARMWEWYWVKAAPESRSYVECLATYSNFRRFTVTTSEDVQ